MHIKIDHHFIHDQVVQRLFKPFGIESLIILINSYNYYPKKVVQNHKLFYYCHFLFMDNLVGMSLNLINKIWKQFTYLIFDVSLYMPAMVGKNLNKKFIIYTIRAYIANNFAYVFVAYC